MFSPWLNKAYLLPIKIITVMLADEVGACSIMGSFGCSRVFVFDFARPKRSHNWPRAYSRPQFPTLFESGLNTIRIHSTSHNALKELRHRSCILKKMAKLFKIVISNPFQSSPSSAILVPFCSRITPLVFFLLSKPLFLGFATF